MSLLSTSITAQPRGTVGRALFGTRTPIVINSQFKSQRRANGEVGTFSRSRYGWLILACIIAAHTVIVISARGWPMILRGRDREF